MSACHNMDAIKSMKCLFLYLYYGEKEEVHFLILILIRGVIMSKMTLNQNEMHISASSKYMWNINNVCLHFDRARVCYFSYFYGFYSPPFKWHIANLNEIFHPSLFVNIDLLTPWSMIQKELEAWFVNFKNTFWLRDH